MGNSGGQTVLVASQGNPGQQGTLTVLQQGSQQILIPSGALNLKALQGLKVIPLAKQSQQPGKIILIFKCTQKYKYIYIYFYTQLYC